MILFGDAIIFTVNIAPFKSLLKPLRIIVSQAAPQRQTVLVLDHRAFDRAISFDQDYIAGRIKWDGIDGYVVLICAPGRVNRRFDVNLFQSEFADHSFMG